MTTKRWIGGSGAFADATEWSPTGIPGLGDTALLGAGANVSDGATLKSTVVLADPTASLTLQGYVTDAPAAGAVGLAAVSGGGALLGTAAASLTGPLTPYLSGGLLLVGSPNAASPFVIQSVGGSFYVNSTLDVVGTVSVTGAGAGTNSTEVTLGGTINVEPDGNLVTTGSALVFGTATIAGGRLDASQGAFGSPFNTVSFDGSSGTLVVGGGVSTVANFRAGDVIDVKGISRSGTLSPSPSLKGEYLVGVAGLSFTGPTAVGATYTATPDGTGGTLVTVSGPNAGRTPASQYIFGFAFSAATVTFGANGHALLTAPNGTVTDVTGVPTLQFLDGTINERTGTPVDPLFYYARNPDVWAAHVNGGLNAQQHYDQYGWHEGRDPSALFSTTYYLNQNPDVAAAGVNPLQHYDQFGWQQGRDPSVLFSTTAYLAHNPDVAQAGIDPLLHYIQYGEGENRVAYAATPHPLGPQDPLVVAAFVDAERPDVAAAGVDATAWFHTYGWVGGTAPDALFDVNYYLAHNPDVAAAHVDPLTHYEQYGWKEGRNPSAAFSDSAYLAHNPDVAAAGIDPLLHYLYHGQPEGRAIYPA